MIAEKEDIRPGVIGSFHDVERTVLSQPGYEQKQKEYIRTSADRETLRSGFQTFKADVDAVRRIRAASGETDTDGEKKKKVKPLDPTQKTRLMEIARRSQNRIVSDQGPQREKEEDLRFIVEDKYSQRVMQTWMDMHTAMNAARILGNNIQTRQKIIEAESQHRILKNEEVDTATELNIAVFKVAVGMYERFNIKGRDGQPDRAALMSEINTTLRNLARELGVQSNIPIPFYERIVSSMLAQFSAYVSLREEGWDIRIPTPNEDRRGMDFIATRTNPDGTTERLIVDVKSGNQDEERIMIEPPEPYRLTREDRQLRKPQQERLITAALHRDIDAKVQDMVDDGDLDPKYIYDAGKLMETTSQERRENPEKNGQIHAMIVIIRPDQFLRQQNG